MKELMLQSEESTDVQIESLFEFNMKHVWKISEDIWKLTCKRKISNSISSTKKKKKMCSMERNDMDNWISLI